MDDTGFARPVDTENALRGLYKTPGEVAEKKVLPHLDKHCRRLIELSPFLCIATAGADGSADVSPRGDAPGFVGVPDDKTLVIPDRVGNNRIDTLANVMENQNLVLIFFIPGFNDILRANLWSEEAKTPRDAMPTAGQIYKDQLALAESAEDLEAGFVAKRAKGLY